MKAGGASDTVSCVVIMILCVVSVLAGYIWAKITLRKIEKDYRQYEEKIHKRKDDDT